MVIDTEITSWRHLLLRWTDFFSWHEQSSSFPCEDNDNSVVRFSRREQMQNATGSFMKCSEDNKNRWDAEIIWFKPEVMHTVFERRKRLSKGSYYQEKWQILTLPIFANWAENLGSCWSFCKCIWNAMVYDLMAPSGHPLTGVWVSRQGSGDQLPEAHDWRNMAVGL